MIDSPVTDGERLCNYINHRLLRFAPWQELGVTLEATGRSGELVDFYREIAAVTQTGRIVSAGVSLSETLGIDDPALRKEFIALLRNYFGIPSHFLDEMFRFCHRAIRAALEPFRTSLQNQMEAWAKRNHPRCYMCGTTLNFGVRNLIDSYTCEHIWPRGYGGNTIADNLLPACKSCNSNKKANFATWVMPGIQSLVLGLAPSEERLQEIPGSCKFSIHYRVAQRLASRKRMSLKSAFLQIGPWENVRIRDIDDVVDIFNLENHVEERAFI
jgi:hypothetical protein